jgi:hypothetical protein
MRDRKRLSNQDLSLLEGPMSKSSKDTPTYYEIKIKGHLEDRWADWFEDLSFVYQDDGTTILSGPIKDQAALRSVLNHISDLGLSLISVQPIEPTQ